MQNVLLCQDLVKRVVKNKRVVFKTRFKESLRYSGMGFHRRDDACPRVSVSMALGGFKLFSETNGLHINASKSEIYCTGMESHEINRINRVFGFKIGMLPIRYLGLPMSAYKIKVADCEALVDKMCTRV